MLSDKFIYEEGSEDTSVNKSGGSTNLGFTVIEIMVTPGKIYT